MLDRSALILDIFAQRARTGEGKLPQTDCKPKFLDEKLLEQPEQEARDLALTMELYTSGSLNIFAHETNVDTKNRIQSYDIHDLGEELKQPCHYSAPW